MNRLFYLQMNPSVCNILGENHYFVYMKFCRFTLFTIEIGISNNQLAGVILNPKGKVEKMNGKQEEQP